MDPNSFSILDPDLGGGKKCKEIGNNCKFIQFFKVPDIYLHKLHCFLLLSNLLCFLKLKKTLHKVIFNKFAKNACGSTALNMSTGNYL